MKTLEQIMAEYLAKAKSKPIKKYSIIKDGIPLCEFDSDKKPNMFCFTNEADETWAKDNGFELAERYVMGDGTIRMFYKPKPSPEGLYHSADGRYYQEAELPELNADFCTQLYADEVKAERNARISDSDQFAQLEDITVQPAANEPRRALTETEREALLTYRQALRDLPTQEGFPFVEFPNFPAVLDYELGQKLASRQAMENRHAI